MKKIDTLHLTGQNSINLFYNLFIPTKEVVEQHERINKKISNGINIEETNNGFIATINDLNLSFLKLTSS